MRISILWNEQSEIGNLTCANYFSLLILGIIKVQYTNSAFKNKKMSFYFLCLLKLFPLFQFFVCLILILFSYWKDSVRFTSTSPPPPPPPPPLKKIYNDQRSLNMLPNFENAIFYYGPSNVIDHNIRT